MCEIYDDGDYCTIWNERERKARKPHRCSCCRSTIQPGTVYIVHFSLFDGDATSEKMCVECVADRQAFADAHGGILFNPGSFLLRLSDCISEGDEDDRRWVGMLDGIQRKRDAARSRAAAN